MKHEIQYKKLHEQTTTSCQICRQAYENGEIKSEDVLLAEFKATLPNGKTILVDGYGCRNWIEVASEKDLEQYFQ